jgi:hypothetical protein
VRGRDVGFEARPSFGIGTHFSVTTVHQRHH